ncbi:MAG: radical SAM protein [Thermodesulfobacteriota bacterium]
MNSLRICERFHSIQGESTWAGLPCVFFRLAGCNLRCAWCDAAYSQEDGGETAAIGELVDWAGRYRGAIVEITGGEPLLQEGVYPLIEELLGRGRTVLVETNGSLAIDRLPAAAVAIVDVKCPGSGMAGHFHLPNLALLRDHDQLKFVLSSREDYRWALAFIRQHRLLGRELLFSPVSGRLDGADLAAWILADDIPVRLQLQLHKLLWPGIDRGV